MHGGYNLVDANQNTHLLALGFLASSRPDLFPERTEAGLPRISLDANGNVGLRCDRDAAENAWEDVKDAHDRAFRFLRNQSMIARDRDPDQPAEHRVALHFGAHSEHQPQMTYAPDHRREVEGLFYT